MAKVNYFLLAETCILDTAGRISVINMFDQVNTTEKVATPPKFTIVIGITPEKDDIKDNKINFRVEILEPDGKELLKVEGGGEVPKDKFGKQIVSPLDLSGKLRFEKAGKHVSKLYVNSKKKAEFSFTVNHNQKAPV